MENSFDEIFVNRIGIGNDSNMTTTKLINVFEKPNQTLKFTGNELIECVNEPTSVFSTNINQIKSLEIKGDIIKSNGEIKPNNILGPSDILVVDSQVNIPEEETTQENLNFYGCKLLKPNDVFNLENNKPMPLLEMYVGRNYVKDYLLVDGLGDGFYIETHDTPHYHQPLSPNCSGHMILGIKLNGNLHLTKFKIPYGYGLYTPPFVFHSDAYLIGYYHVIYNKANTFETLIFKYPNEQIVRIF